MLRDKIQDDLTHFIKEREKEKIEVLRFLLSEIKNQEIEKKDTLLDAEIVKVIKKEVKKLQEANEMFEKGKRVDLVDQNNRHIAIMSVYLPPEISDKDLEDAVRKIIQENKELYEKNPNAIIGIAMKNLSGQADSQRILETIKNYSS